MAVKEMIILWLMIDRKAIILSWELDHHQGSLILDRGVQHRKWQQTQR